MAGGNTIFMGYASVVFQEATVITDQIKTIFFQIKWLCLAPQSMLVLIGGAWESRKERNKKRTYLVQQSLVTGKRGTIVRFDPE